ncbi:hypothetical protein BC826DRAFT_1175761 [Russula brevipes]|nr:hypothetical protein BC826DRAFT_1175761 [Russula brevipes]
MAYIHNPTDLLRYAEFQYRCSMEGGRVELKDLGRSRHEKGNGNVDPAVISMSLRVGYLRPGRFLEWALTDHNPAWPIYELEDIDIWLPAGIVRGGRRDHVTMATFLEVYIQGLCPTPDPQSLKLAKNKGPDDESTLVSEPMSALLLYCGKRVYRGIRRTGGRLRGWYVWTEGRGGEGIRDETGRIRDKTGDERTRGSNKDAFIVQIVDALKQRESHILCTHWNKGAQNWSERTAGT